MTSVTKRFFYLMYEGTKNKFYQLYFISSHNINSVCPHEQYIAVFIFITKGAHNVLTDNERLG
jgi:hypothetical protein